MWIPLQTIYDPDFEFFLFPNLTIVCMQGIYD